MDKFSSQIAEAMGAGREQAGPRLLSPRDFLQLTTDEVLRANRYDRPLSVALAVVDGLVLMRKESGLEAVEAAFATVAETTLGTLRGMDRVGRLGRGELGFLMPETTLSNAATVCERLRDAVAGADLGARPGALSIGVAGLSPRRRDPKAFLMTACFELRRAQSQGGDRVCAAEPEIVNVSIPRSAQIH